MPRLQQYVRQLRPRNESHVNHVDRIQSLLTEGGSTAGATEMESHIVIAYNGGYENAPDTYDVEKESYEKSKHTTFFPLTSGGAEPWLQAMYSALLPSSFHAE